MSESAYDDSDKPDPESNKTVKKGRIELKELFGPGLANTDRLEVWLSGYSLVTKVATFSVRSDPTDSPLITKVKVKSMAAAGVTGQELDTTSTPTLQVGPPEEFKLVANAALKPPGYGIVIVYDVATMAPVDLIFVS